ncbi:hypothetical protein SAMN05444371_2580 [Epilithonimonas mollis]|uniref:Uncharacterized protein n=2 Tax=Epilithonimonas mollis TaxID=216903 RepID=A0A1M6T1H2_9FLAO|nr:hypothetical protein SAMN05444371_2580 [Epilithonimonas mollis]
MIFLINNKTSNKMQNLKSKYEQEEMKVSDGLWERLEEKLDQVPAKKRQPKMIWLRYVAVAILILNFSGVSWLNNIENQVKNSREFKFRTENQIFTAKEKAAYEDEVEKSLLTNSSKIKTQKKEFKNENSSTPFRMTNSVKKESSVSNQIAEKESIIKKEALQITPKPEEKLAQNDIIIPKQKVKYISSSDLLFGVEIDKAKAETPKSSMGINVPKIKNESDFPSPKRVKLFGITLYEKDSVNTK